MPSIGYLQWRLSGGVANSNPLLSFGGLMSDNRGKSGQGDDHNLSMVRSQTSGAFASNVASCWHAFRWDTADNLTITGIRHQYQAWTGAPSAVFAGRVWASGASGQAHLRETHMSDGTAIGCIPMDDGSFVMARRPNVGDFDFPTVSTSGSGAAVVQETENIFDNVTSADAWNGLTDYRMLYLYNAAENGDGSPGQAFRKVKIWIDAQPASGTISLGYDAVQFNTEPTAPADRFTAPAGIAFAAYPNEASALVWEELAGLQKIPIWFRRVITPGQSAGDVLGDAFDIYMVAH